MITIRTFGIIGTTGYFSSGVTNTDPRKGVKIEDNAYNKKELIPGTPEQYIRSEPKMHRNDYCNCGSGNKYKKCCLIK